MVELSFEAEFYIARAEALNSYNVLEQNMAFLFGRALGTDVRYATLIVSKVVNSRARNEIVQRVVDMCTSNQFAAFTKTLFGIVGPLDQERNKLVHWHMENDFSEAWLKPADVLSESDARMTLSDVREMSLKAAFLADVVLQFDENLLDETHNPALRERFRQPLSYPPKHDDPLSLFYREHEALRRSSQG